MHNVYSLCSNLRGCQGLKIQSKVLLRTESPAGAVLERLGSAGSHSIVRPGAPTKSKLGVWHNPARIQFVKDWNFIAFIYYLYIYIYYHLFILFGWTAYFDCAECQPVIQLCTKLFGARIHGEEPCQTSCFLGSLKCQEMVDALEDFQDLHETDRSDVQFNQAFLALCNIAVAWTLTLFLCFDSSWLKHTPFKVEDRAELQQVE